MVSENRHEVPALHRLSTGNAQLDEILGGGFPANSINVLMGEPGSGKTILAEQVVFANAETAGRPILYLTTLSEPLDKVVRYLQQLDFYDEAKLHAGVRYESMGHDLAEHGVSVLVARLKQAIIEHRPKIIVIDSFKAVHDLATSVPEMRRVLYELAGLLTAYETTAFLVGEYSASQMNAYPEFAVTDGIVELARNKHSTRDERFLRVLKLRGSSYLEGLHAFSITDRGLDVYPRLVSPAAAPAYEILTERYQLGIAGLDKLFVGGLYRGRSTFIFGPTGSGKTTLALQFVLEGIRHGEQCLFVSFEENPTQLDAQIRSQGEDPDRLRKDGLYFLYVSPVELRIDSIVTRIFHTIREKGIRRVVVDAVGDMISAADDVQRLHGYLYALAQHFAVHGVTSLFPYEVLPGKDVDARLSALADTIIRLGMEVDGTRGRRTVQVVKARGVAHDLDVHELQITGKGVEVP